MQSRSEFIGHSPKTITALITPFFKGRVDYDSLGVLLDHQIKGGIDGFVLSGTTGESPTLERQEVEEIFRYCQKKLSKDFPLWIGTGGNSTKKTVENTKKAKELGAQAALVSAPYYNKPPQRGLIEHYKALVAIEIPIVLYNVPGRTGISIEQSSIETLAHERNIFGIKEASGKREFFQPIISSLKNKLLLLSGDDESYVDFLKRGGDGIISVATHILPQSFLKWKSLIKQGQSEEAEKDFAKYKKLIQLLFVESNPIPVKKAMQLMGVIQSAELRLPLVELENDNTEKIKNELKLLGIL
jgi:4-hydroxy-tetrahydrodipicolinate synthase